MTQRPLCFFVHHQGHGHAKRCESIISHIGDRPTVIMSARRDIFGDVDDRIEFVELPDMIAIAVHTDFDSGYRTEPRK